MSAWLTRDEALDRLGVRAQTLYAYVSRNQIGMQPDPADPRRSLYRLEDVEALTTRRARGRRVAAIAESAVAWGEPVFATQLSTVIHGRLIYRGEDAVTFSRDASLEDAARLLWASASTPRFATSGAPAEQFQENRVAVFRPELRENKEVECFRVSAENGNAAETGIDQAFLVLARLAARGQPSLGRNAAVLQADAMPAIAALAGALGAAPGAEPVHLRLARGWRVEQAAEVLRRVMVLVADHELNASAFAARVAASTGAPLVACLLAGLSTLYGPRHGTAADAVAMLVDDAARIGVRAAMARWIDHDRPLPGFGHPLYPDGDPRGAALLADMQLEDHILELRQAAFDATGAQPTVDFALVALTRSYRLPVDAPIRLFALGRSVGWTAHAIEQVMSGKLIRPRARYEGPLPAGA
ncbi:MAG: citrate synthase [Aquamicrobium sp.]|uniref:citrate synthase n=1 Tax=Mesorhizobium sp. Pch-S TaxID=2082387 RepID=UPI001011A793|nr:citrate synthase [Mesorhizobium sp. Pch-S]MBR2691841.1 citrate synthase [Aquamicrobium sp.]QAZ43017.1 citrate synthase [Mesorhizobium sp. Pch-S]